MKPLVRAKLLRSSERNKVHRPAVFRDRCVQNFPKNPIGTSSATVVGAAAACSAGGGAHESSSFHQLLARVLKTFPTIVHNLNFGQEIGQTKQATIVAQRTIHHTFERGLFRFYRFPGNWPS